MKITEILTHVSPKLRVTAERHANVLGATHVLFSKIRFIEEGNLLRYADENVPRYNKRRGYFIEILPREKRLLNIAERLVVAVRIEQRLQSAKPLRARDSRSRKTRSVANAGLTTGGAA